MMKYDIRSVANLVEYLTDCTLATVAHLKMLKSASKSETSRQISIAQTAIDHGISMGIEFKGTRAYDVIHGYQGRVHLWAEQYKR